MEIKTLFVDACYLAASIFFVLGLKGLTHPKTGLRGIYLAEVGMLLAVVGTLLHQDIITYTWIIIGLIAGAIPGALLSIWIPMTAVPQRTALCHAFGGLAVCLVGIVEYTRLGGNLGTVKMVAIGLELVLGSLTFTGSLLAAGKLQGVFPSPPITFKGQNIFNFGLLAVMLGILGYLVVLQQASPLFYVLLGLGLVFGLLLVLPIGAADMPTVIAILNSYAGLAASATGFVLGNNVLIIAGALDGGSGFILSILMCKAMNRSWGNVMFGAFGKQPQGGPAAQRQDLTYRDTSIEDAALLLASSGSVIVVPGYGMAVSQAQYKVRELMDMLEKRGCDVKYAIHPVAGRMPGHMNVLLAEADVPYEKLFDMDAINAEFPQTDVALVIGANDVTNPAARHDKSSPIYGMPILNVDQARNVMVIKRSMNPGFAGIDNELYYNPKTMMVFGDAKAVVTKLAHEVPAND
ncbi:MAG TPA: NAD(P)(+) transhydrogenase (Re/Si-specific) subunit beta [bacterium]|nr:NAD(P)(+) transhydrogenase (Re/Si-specific) subunit beta [bacterium]